ncbi:MAG: glycosyltransferase family 39 protein, partial [Chloroflexia bacterium]|nr:glycosyltransferase family 39 protein [Chloroflexia bacterium]
SAALQGVRLDLQGIGNPYYAATVRSMLEGWPTFFFASFDPAGFVAVDKPPLGFWVQALSAKLLGYGGVALLLPQVLATVGSVVQLWWLVRQPFGPAAGLLAALTLALTPIAVATGRTTTIDPLLVLILLGAAWALLRAIERGDLRWLLLSALLIGLGFNVKMLQAYLVVPAWGVTYLFAGRARLPHRVGHLAAASAVLLVVSFSWATVVQLTPPERRPYVGSSSANSPFDLAFGYNGLQRLLPASMTDVATEDAGGTAPPSPGAILGAFGAVETGERGLLRLFNGSLAAQIAWLLPLALVGFVAAWWQEPGVLRTPFSARRTALLFWGGWLLTTAAFFSVANQFHRYYLVMLAQPIAALVGSGLAALWADWRRPGARGRLLPISVAASAALAAAIAHPFPAPGATLAPVLLGAGAVAAIGLAVARPRVGAGVATRSDPGWRRAIVPLAVVAGAIALFLGPAIWSGWSVRTPVSNVLPAAGPGGSLLPPMPTGDGAIPGLDSYAPPDPALVAYLEANQGGERFVLATANSLSAAPLIIELAAPVAALGGFIGQDPIRSVAEVRGMVEVGEVRFFLVPDPGRVGLLTTMLGVFGGLTDEDGPRLPSFGLPDQTPPPQAGSQDPATFLRLFLTDNVRWVADTCEAVPAERWQTPGRAAANPLTGLETLYDCGALRH